ncbi:ABC transporter of LPS O-antigen [Legionella rubrilucens]|uniref:ABC transporter of LPS O-antigen n=1 Tax=Legionella rubrilucens TaxID=458 RepID=A0A0W0XXV3_9GAMM|nr:ABC transporter ATP-binding protein [Legionella rubrilucens]KTD49531.1 ABC transporter of LPS O-antigen [Legionella rubrilucens]
MNLHDKAIEFKNVDKTYKLYNTPWQMMLDALGLSKGNNYQQFFALKNVNLTIYKGERLGIVGRNGAGKSTLLKLMTGNFLPTQGDVTVNGKIQALMSTGLGFHPEFTGLENIKASLIYNGLTQDQYNEAVEDIIDFVELGDFLYQPIKTYSLGMQSRLYFATATAIKPDILIVDEVLGAGDAYFSAKSADRMKKLTGSGCTLLLVSHSTAQVLQFCETAIWLECGEIVMQGKAIDIVKRYEEYTKRLEIENQVNSKLSNKKPTPIIQSKWLREKLLIQVISQHTSTDSEKSDLLLNVIDQKDRDVSRWPSLIAGLKIKEIRLLDRFSEEISEINSGDELTIQFTIRADKKDKFDVYFVVLLFTEDGRWLSRHCSQKYTFELHESDEATVKLVYKNTLLGNGKYIFSAAIYQTLDLYDLSTATYYDLLSRSYQFEVKGKYKDDCTLFYHPAEWCISEDDNNKIQPAELFSEID